MYFLWGTVASLALLAAHGAANKCQTMSAALHNRSPQVCMWNHAAGAHGHGTDKPPAGVMSSKSWSTPDCICHTGACKDCVQLSQPCGRPDPLWCHTEALGLHSQVPQGKCCCQSWPGQVPCCHSGTFVPDPEGRTVRQMMPSLQQKCREWNAMPCEAACKPATAATAAADPSMQLRVRSPGRTHLTCAVLLLCTSPTSRHLRHTHPAAGAWG